jgi:hypothetical protein|tara:strand:+ start:253 stop:459 length:207 start_codon:yes stop_codon:yes gene_type:complete
MDTYNIIKQLTAKTDMISGESLKDNYKALLPIVNVHKGWATYGFWKFYFPSQFAVVPGISAFHVAFDK